MTLRERVIQDAMTGKIENRPKPFIPSVQFINEELGRRQKQTSAADMAIPVSVGDTSDGLELVRQFTSINDRMQAAGERIQEANSVLAVFKQASSDLVTSVQRKAEALAAEIDILEAAPKHSSKWTESAGDYFYATDKVDLMHTTAMVDIEKHMVTLPAASRTHVQPVWLDGAKGTVAIVSGPGQTVSLSPGSTLSDLMSGTPDIYTIELMANGPGVVEISLLIPTPKAGVSTTEPVKINRLELTVVGTVVAQPHLRRNDDTIVLLERKTVIGKSMWSFGTNLVKAIDLHLFVDTTGTGAGTYYVMLDDLGLFDEKYKPGSSVVSNSVSFDGNTINHVSLSVKETVPEQTSIDYYVAVDPIVASGAFMDRNENIVDPGYAAVRFDPAVLESGGIPASMLRRWYQIQGAEGYETWEPDWRRISPLDRGTMSSIPRVVTFDHVEQHTFPSGLSVVSMREGDEVSPVTHDGNTGWWRPMAGMDESVPAGSTAFPDLTAGNVDFFKIYYWPSEETPIPGSVRLNAGSQLYKGEVSGSGYLWNLSEQSTPGLQDITERGLAASSSGVIEIDAPGPVLYDRIRNLRYDGSHDTPFQRGDDYQVFGSGSFIEVDVSIIEAIARGFDSPGRAYELTYTVEKTSGIIDLYHYTTTLWVSPDGIVTATISQPDRIRRIQIAGLNEGYAVDTVNDIEFPQGRGNLEVRLPTGYVRITIQTGDSTFDPRESVVFNVTGGHIASVSTPFGMEEVPFEEHMLHTRRSDHSRFSLMPGPSGSKWLMVNDPGSEHNLYMDDVVIGPNERNNIHGKYLFHPSASGLVNFYHLQYETASTDETNLLFKAELRTNNPDVTPSIDWYRIDMGQSLSILTGDLMNAPLKLQE